MDTKKLKAICCTMLLYYPCSAYDFKSASEITLFKNYALSSCVASNYEKDLVSQDAIDSLNGNREYGNISLNAYHEINDALKKWANKKYISKAGNNSEFFMCVDFQNSKDVLEIYKKYDPCKSSENWSSKKEYELR